MRKLLSIATLMTANAGMIFWGRHSLAQQVSTPSIIGLVIVVNIVGYWVVRKLLDLMYRRFLDYFGDYKRIARHFDTAHKLESAAENPRRIFIFVSSWALLIGWQQLGSTPAPRILVLWTMALTIFYGGYVLIHSPIYLVAKTYIYLHRCASERLIPLYEARLRALTGEDPSHDRLLNELLN